MAYIRTASAYKSPIIFIPIEPDGKISKESFLSVYPRACGMYFHHKNNDFAVTLSNGRFIPPPEGWRGTIFYGKRYLPLPLQVAERGSGI